MFPIPEPKDLLNVNLARRREITLRMEHSREQIQEGTTPAVESFVGFYIDMRFYMCQYINTIVFHVFEFHYLPGLFQVQFRSL